MTFTDHPFGPTRKGLNQSRDEAIIEAEESRDRMEELPDIELGMRSHGTIRKPMNRYRTPDHEYAQPTSMRYQPMNLALYPHEDHLIGSKSRNLHQQDQIITSIHNKRRSRDDFEIGLGFGMRDEPATFEDVVKALQHGGTPIDAAILGRVGMDEDDMVDDGRYNRDGRWEGDEWEGRKRAAERARMERERIAQEEYMYVKYQATKGRRKKYSDIYSLTPSE
jgi:hypothetical protein